MHIATYGSACSFLQRSPQNFQTVHIFGWLSSLTKRERKKTGGEAIKTHFLPHYCRFLQITAFHHSTNEMINEPKINHPNYDKNDYDASENYEQPNTKSQTNAHR